MQRYPMGDNKTSEAIINYFEHILTIAEKQQEALTESGKNIWKDAISQNLNKIVKIISNTPGNSYANDLLVERYNELIRELHDDFPHWATIKDLLTEFMEIYLYAIAKHSQAEWKSKEEMKKHAMGLVSLKQRTHDLYYGMNKEKKPIIKEYKE